MQIIRAAALGMCFGVKDAIALARQKASRGPVTILGDLVHNETVMDELRSAGVQVVNQLEAVATPEVLITAHGAARKTIAQAQARGFSVTEATCPLVHHAHRALQQLVAQGCYPVVVGQRHHVEVRGMTGDLAEYSVILHPDDLAAVPERPRYGVVAQTTQPVERVQQLVALLRQHFPHAEVRWVDTVCRPTKQRQQAARELARQSDVVIVIGGAHSNNTRELAATCAQYCPRVHHVQGPDDLHPAWLQGARVVGITAGTSTPDEIIDAVEARLREWSQPQAPALAPASHPGELCLARA
ncbi:4-hydroxy-3-methylbut-2-enyl diphosphate reductase [Fontisphaera persica]|uniref:4-hydroxy-3-methylbut-2-enyl diphosphate reductase n=1 Tax=Fontisphaera persica TaxID=2974023 RepID=UPI0024BFF6B3|nr:4-hydroxy-3-methylbut-2-enyl diphosphate reductase [Fontisphaera persica]WCJ60126.1 4-hydroxy-3-methylbut-2-enyl diphosphate reductase [Fontisphaera persica]